jgi:rubrerythrin
MKKPTSTDSDAEIEPEPNIGDNRTGIDSAPADALAMVEGASAGVPNASLDQQALNAARAAEAAQAEPVGRMPRRRRVPGGSPELRAAIDQEQGALLLDFLGERLAFERTGTRLYEALLSKLEAAERYPGRPARAEVALLRDQELAHFQLLSAAIEQLGGDPTALTPSADVNQQVASGLLQAVTDPRTTFPQALKLMVTVELMEKDSWETLVDIAERIGLAAMAAEFLQAGDQEEEHLAAVRTWSRRALESEAAFARDAPAEDAAATPPGT